MRDSRSAKAPHDALAHPDITTGLDTCTGDYDCDCAFCRYITARRKDVHTGHRRAARTTLGHGGLPIKRAA